MDSLEQLEAELYTLKQAYQGARVALAALSAKYDKDLSDAEIAHQAEVARLREYAAACERTAGLNQQENVTLKLDLATERAAHEATKAERDAEHERACKETVTHDQLLLEVSSYRSGMMAAEARVAELEREKEQGT